MTTAPLPPGGSLFERVGGREGVARIVEEFYARVAQDELLRPIFPADLTPGREKQQLFLEQWLGGEQRYTERFGHPRLRRRHFPFVIDKRAAGRWLHHFGAALRACEVADADVATILAALAPLAQHMVNAGDEVPRAPLDDARLS